MNVNIYNKQTDLKISEKTTQAIVAQVLNKEGKSCDEVSIHFVDSGTICDLHAQYFDDPSVTDCISFPIDPPGAMGYCVLGEVFVCPSTAIEYAKNHQSTPYYETTLYVVHGLLHLLGYDDIDERVKEMRAAESTHMKNLESMNLILQFAD